MNDSVTMQADRPSVIGSFFKSAMSSAMSGAVMATIVSFVTPFFAAAGTATFLGTLGATAPLMILATGLFGGVMGIKRVMFDVPNTSRNATNFIPVPVSGLSGPALGTPVVAADMAQESPQSNKNWVAETGGERDAQQRIQQIIANGSMGDKDRASAILAAREAAAANDNGRNA